MATEKSGTPSGQMVTVVRLTNSRIDSAIPMDGWIGKVGRVLCVNQHEDLVVVAFEDGDQSRSDAFGSGELLACDPQFTFSDGEALCWLFGVARNADIYRGGEPSAEIVVERWMMRTGVYRPGMTERQTRWDTSPERRRENAERYGMRGLGRIPSSFPVLRTMDPEGRNAFISWLIALVQEAESLIFAGLETGFQRLLDGEAHIIDLLNRRGG